MGTTAVPLSGLSYLFVKCRQVISNSAPTKGVMGRERGGTPRNLESGMRTLRSRESKWTSWPGLTHSVRSWVLLSPTYTFPYCLDFAKGIVWIQLEMQIVALVCFEYEQNIRFLLVENASVSRNLFCAEVKGFLCKSVSSSSEWTALTGVSCHCSSQHKTLRWWLAGCLLELPSFHLLPSGLIHKKEREKTCPMSPACSGLHVAKTMCPAMVSLRSLSAGSRLLAGTLYILSHLSDLTYFVT